MSKRYYYFNETKYRAVNMNTTHDMGNNETVKTGVFPNNNGTFTAMTFTKSKDFKTEAGAKKWFARQMAD